MERAVAGCGVTAVAEAAADNAGSLGAAVTAGADICPAVGLASRDRPVLSADPAAAFRGLVAVPAERGAVGVAVLVRGECSAGCALTLGPRNAVPAEHGSVGQSAGRTAHPPASGALLDDHGVLDVAASADRAVLAVSDDEPVLLAPAAGLHPRFGVAPAAAPALRCCPQRQRVWPAAMDASRPGDRIAEAGLVQQARKPDQCHGAVRRRSGPCVRVLRQMRVQLPCGSRGPCLRPLKNGLDLRRRHPPLRHLLDVADQTGPDLVQCTPPLPRSLLARHDRSGRRMTVRRRATGTSPG